MGRTIKGKSSTDATTPIDAIAPIVFVKQIWSDDWKYERTVHFHRARHTSGGEGIGDCELRRAYGGAVRESWQNAAARDPIDLAGWFVKLVLIMPKGMTDLWVGQISSSVKEVHASDTEAAGWQTWVAHSMLQMLGKTHVHESIWVNSEGVEQTLGWVPPVNGRDERNLLVGNRSADTYQGDYLYGGTDIWSHYDYLQYVLDRFVDNSANNGPTWTIGGQVQILKDLKTTIPIKANETVATLLRKLIPVRLGIDFKIVPDATGFEVQVFALSADSSGGGIPVGAIGNSLPRNPHRIDFKAAENPAAVTIRVAETLDRQYDRIRVIGRRIVVCCTLRWTDGSLVAKWPSGLEAQYINNGLPPWNETADGLDAARKDERFRLVFQAYGAPNNWDWQDGEAAPVLDSEGVVTGTGADRQSIVRGILPWLPLREGYDYTARPPLNGNLSGYESAFMPPTAWLMNEDTGRWVTADQVGIGVHANPTDWGLTLSASPNHLLAGVIFNDVTKTNTPALYDWHDLKFTVAMETDQRLELSYERTSGWSDKGETLVIEVPTAELWYLANDTIVGVNKDGTLQQTVGGQVLRNDADRLAMVMAGAIARYNMQRTRATIRMNGYWPFAGYVGQILDVIEAGTGAQYIGAPVTAVDWEASSEGNPPSTVIHTGFAR